MNVRIPQLSACLTMIAVAISAPAAAGQHMGEPVGEPYTGVPTVTPVDSDAAVSWRADLAEMARELVSRHGDPFNKVSEEDYRAAVDRLNRDIPRLARHEIIVRMTAIVASIGDGHTSLPSFFDPAAGFHALPVRLGWYDEGIFIEAALPEYQSVVGRRVTAIGGVPIEEAIERVTPLMSRDNDIWIRTLTPLYLAYSEVLHSLGMSDDPMGASFTLDEAETVQLASQPEPTVMTHGVQSFDGWVNARDTSPEASPTWLSRPNEPYWSDYLTDSRTLYIQFNQVNDAEHGPGVHEFFAHALAPTPGRVVDRYVLDLRKNRGGEGDLNTGIVREFVDANRANPEAEFYVIIGRNTFSAAQALSHMLDQWTDVVFVGEPTGSSPQFWGDHSFFRLSESGILISASPTWWQPGGPYDSRPYLPPRYAFEPRFSDYLANRDPAMDAIPTLADEARLSDRLLSVASEGVAAMRAVAEEWSQDPKNRYRTASSEINRAAYQLQREEKREDAMALFRWNVEVHPNYANGWDSLGEQLMATGRHPEGIEAYRKAYALDPSVGRAAEIVARAGIESP